MGDELLKPVKKNPEATEKSPEKEFDNFLSQIGEVGDKAQQIIEKGLNNLVKLATWIEQNQEWIFSNFEALGKALEKYNLTLQVSYKVLKKYKWFISPTLPPSFIFEAVKIGRKSGNQRNTINSLFIKYFSDNKYRNLVMMVETWDTNPLFTRRRIKIIRDCVSTLQNAKSRTNPSNVVLPTLISQIEGISNAYKKSKGFKARASKQKDRHREWVTWFTKQTSSQFLLTPELIELSNYIFLDVLFQTAIPNQPLENPFTFSRHKILHGEFLTYGRMDNTIRAFLILDFLAALK